MLRQEELLAIIDDQYQKFVTCCDMGFIREDLQKIPVQKRFVTIITGLRRSGKSTLLLQMMNNSLETVFYLHFDDFRLAAFEQSDWNRVYNEILKRNAKILCFDEIQLIKGWELFVNQLINENFQVYVTGSNATMLSIELGTQLTGRHLSTELFPFSYSEFLGFKNLENSTDSVMDYLLKGGIPEYLKTENGLILNTLIEDILVRDIAVRHNIKDIASLRQLTLLLLQNIGNRISANKLVGMFGIKAASTFLDYFSFLSDTYLFSFVPMFSYSLKTQVRNPKKVYLVDLGLYTENNVSSAPNFGQRFENLVFLQLRRRHKDIFYYANSGECDFVITENNKVTQLLQVCYQIDDDNFKREFDGLFNAMNDLNISEGIIVTLKQSDTFTKDGRIIKMIPATEFLK